MKPPTPAFTWYPWWRPAVPGRKADRPPATVARKTTVPICAFATPEVVMVRPSAPVAVSELVPLQQGPFAREWRGGPGSPSPTNCRRLGNCPEKPRRLRASFPPLAGCRHAAPTPMLAYREALRGMTCRCDDRPSRRARASTHRCCSSNRTGPKAERRQRGMDRQLLTDGTQPSRAAVRPPATIRSTTGYFTITTLPAACSPPSSQRRK